MLPSLFSYMLPRNTFGPVDIVINDGAISGRQVLIMTGASRARQLAPSHGGGPAYMKRHRDTLAVLVCRCDVV